MTLLEALQIVTDHLNNKMQESPNKELADVTNYLLDLKDEVEANDKA